MICLTLTMLILFLIAALIVLFYPKEQKNTLRMFSISDCQEYTPTTEEMNSHMFKIFLIANIMLNREFRVPKEMRFFYGKEKFIDFFRNILKQQSYFEWKEFTTQINNGEHLVNKLYSMMELHKFTYTIMGTFIIRNFTNNPLNVDPKFKHGVGSNMIDVIKNHFSKDFYTKDANLNHGFELIKELLNYNNCYCQQTNPFIMLLMKPSDYKYCKSISGLLAFNSLALLIGALIIVITNLILEEFINFIFKTASFDSFSNKSTIQIISISMALFFNILVFPFYSVVYKFSQFILSQDLLRPIQGSSTFLLIL